MAEYTGTSFSAPKLDGEALRRYTSKNIKENIFQNNTWKIKDIII